MSNLETNILYGFVRISLFLILLKQYVYPVIIIVLK